MGGGGKWSRGRDALAFTVALAGIGVRFARGSRDEVCVWGGSAHMAES